MPSSVIKTGVKATCPHRHVTFNAETSETGSPGIVDLSKFYCNDCNRELAANFGRGWVLQIATLLKPVDELPPRGGAAKTVKSGPVKEERKPKTFDAIIGEFESKGGGPGTEGLRMLHLMGFEPCPACYALAAKMDAWGVSGCRKAENFTYIIVDALPRGMGHWQKTLKPDGAPDLARWYSAWKASPLTASETAKVTVALAESDESCVRVLLELLFTHAINEAERKYDEALAAEAEAAGGAE